jgi:hypothetical protein
MTETPVTPIVTISPERLAVLQAAADGRLFFARGQHGPTSLMRPRQGGRQMLIVTPAANWLRSQGLIRGPGKFAHRSSIRRVLVITPVGREILESGLTT